MQPTGLVTLGNYIGALSNWLKLQENDEYQCIYSIADLHSLTVRQVPAEFRNRALSFFAQYLACGLDPQKNIMYFQSHVHEHAELTWILNCITYVGEANRMTQFKEKSLKHSDNINMGLMDYPVLMAADILLYNTSLVPVGVDQKQHLELARDLAMRFNNAYSPTFVVPEPHISNVGAKIMSLQNPTAKMSKSDENANATVSILDSEDDIMRKFKKAVTDSENEIRYGEDKAGISNLITIYACCNNLTIEDAVSKLQGMSYAALKEAVGCSVVELLSPIKGRYNDLMSDKEQLLNIARNGAEQASFIARKTLRKVYKKVGLVQL
ncbi:MAG: tryptophan--tRNA ligase [Clostridia bacterium]|nr:tryptophan--tRNA ligase [Clostridia bacterium]